MLHTSYFASHIPFRIFQHSGPGLCDMLLSALKKNKSSDARQKGQAMDLANTASAVLSAGLGRKIFRGVASGIGLASESIHHRTAQGAEEEDAVAQFARYEDVSRQTDEAAWQLDEAQDQLSLDPPAYDSLLSPNPPTHSTHHASNNRLQTPVLLTQRRPGTRTRGFIRAYAPCLNAVGIDQATFLSLIDAINAATIPSPLIQALNLASLAGIAAPEPFTVLISLAVQQATRIGSEMHSRTKTNKLLDELNASFFAPRGLVALVMAWQPSRAGDMLTTVDLEESVEKAANKSSEHGMLKRFQKSSGVVGFEWPETAPLVFPVLDDLATTTTGAKAPLKRAGRFVEEYMDKRARAQWAGENPESKMANAAAPKEAFHSRYADPNHPASSGDPLALVTGGHLSYVDVLAFPFNMMTRGQEAPYNEPHNTPHPQVQTQPNQSSGLSASLAIPLSGVKKIFQEVSTLLMYMRRANRTGHIVPHDRQPAIARTAGAVGCLFAVVSLHGFRLDVFIVVSML
jgi:hypothetical protein